MLCTRNPPINTSLSLSLIYPFFFFHISLSTLNRFRHFISSLYYYFICYELSSKNKKNIIVEGERKKSSESFFKTNTSVHFYLFIEMTENQIGFLNSFHKQPFPFSHHMEQYKFHSFKNSVFFLSLFLIFASQLVSGKPGQGGSANIVTQADYQALQAIKHELVDPLGILRSWNDTTGIGACSGGWAGIKCVGGQVIAIQLPWKGLGGKISEKIGQLQSLRRLSLHDNDLTGSVPISLGLLPNLRGIYLFNNQLSGSIPASIGQCGYLQSLDLSNNQLTGTIPSSLANSTKLYRLNLSYNSISGSIPDSFTRSHTLTFLALQHNNLTGSIPNTWGLGTNNSSSSSYELRSLTLDHNFLTGHIPTSLSLMSNLEEINLGHNLIDGVVPNEMGNLSSLRVLDLSNNAINGSFPTSFSNLHSLVSLNFKGNHLMSPIPESLDRLQNLSVLNLGENRFIGPIPSSVGNISSLTQLDLSENNFTGEIPESLANLHNLSSFDVAYNSLSGRVPSPLLKRFNGSSFVGNLHLCGYSASTQCAPSPPPQVLPSPIQERSRKGRRKLSTKDIILIAAGALLIVLLIICCLLLCCLIRRKTRSKSKSGKSSTVSMPVAAMGAEIESGGGETGGKLVHFDGPFVFTADDLLCATAEIMGKSTYGTAYKATLDDGNQVAVKRLREKVTKGQKEFEAEVAELGKIRHSNILAMRAYYLGPKGEKLLVFDYMSNGSLASFLHARGPETAISWPTRMNIIVGITKGLCYLHKQEDIVHGNLTSSNVFLDEHSHPTIADVGLSRLMTSAANTNVIATAGTQGYRAPELSKLKNATTKTDVYSLGVIMLELLTGKSPSEGTDGVDLPQWVASIVKEEWTNEVFDLELMRDAANAGDELLNTLKLALHCVDPAPTARPEAQQVLEKLEEIKPEVAVVAASSGTDGAGEAVPSKSE